MENITFPVNAELQAQATAAGFISVDQYIMDLIERDADRVAIMQGIEDLNAGRCRPLAEAEASIRRELGLPPRS